jgi:hypothetical protein
MSVSEDPKVPTIAELDGASLPVLLEYLGSDQPQIRADAACALGDRLRAHELESLDGPLRERMETLLAEGPFSVRFEAAIALAELQSPLATPVLLEAAQLRTLRLDAIRALGTVGDPSAIPALSNMLTRLFFPWADRLQAAAALCALGDNRGAAYLVKKLTSRKRAERAAAIHFLGESRHPEGRLLLSRILQDRRDPMRDVAARALGLLRDPSSREALSHALDSAEGELAQDIREALAKLPA